MNTMIILSDNDLNNKFTQVPSVVHKYVIVVLMMNAIKINVNLSIASAPFKLF
jgi:hypothetical protein